MPSTETRRVVAGATVALAEFVTDVRRRGVPDAVQDVLRTARTAVVDAIGCGLFGFSGRPHRAGVRE